MSNRRSDPMPSSRREGRVKAAAAAGGGAPAPAPALTRHLRARDHKIVRSRLTPKTVALPFRAEGVGEVGRTSRSHSAIPIFAPITDSSFPIPSVRDVFGLDLPPTSPNPSALRAEGDIVGQDV